MAREPNPNFMAGVPELMILRLLQEREMYGYEIVQAIRAETGDVVSIGEGVAYTVLHALEREGALKSRRRRVEGRSRIYYALTQAGLKRYQNLAGTWLTLARAIQTVIKQDSFQTFIQTFIMGGHHAAV
ncbi:MAG: PadR family transcriptional regulator [Alphaproteobacteria bacterium]|nr:PadR family transcriptional regulator [Alphaproteobacteria bacterium]